MKADHVVLARRGIIKTVQRGSRSITYEIDLGDPEGVRITVWSQTVHFGSGNDYAAGGNAFVATAREQDRIAADYAAELRALGAAHQEAP